MLVSARDLFVLLAGYLALANGRIRGWPKLLFFAVVCGLALTLKSTGVVLWPAVDRVADPGSCRSVRQSRGCDQDPLFCRAFGDWGYCKHLVATALAANAAGSGAEAESLDVFAGIRRYLNGKDIPGRI